VIYPLLYSVYVYCQPPIANSLLRVYYVILINGDEEMNIKKSLTYFMKLNGCTQADISRLAILNPATISLVINGHRDPTCKTIQKLADLFEVKVSEFIAAGE
jgi:DNA-binding XRE family transcriptional regulator